ncbi:hypothetical protein LCL96_18355 [Rossellomorea aquimaris]|uniref:hypothetical protein n=1 Tax=Rossellomorea aquimaris TaxID=189382 RepID=UPI001CD1D812|nr:hypothetical protein [Rossellomorea aquimaris]MCA1060881.1 hypothetical protein [Rossellomorea aquimaris]
MIQALIGMVFAWLFLFASAYIVFTLPPVFFKKRMTYEKKVVVEAFILSGCSLAVLALHPVYILLKSFAFAALALNVVKVLALPVLAILKKSDRRKYIIMKRFVRKL